jgi:hypothetical protein
VRAQEWSRDGIRGSASFSVNPTSGITSSCAPIQTAAQTGNVSSLLASRNDGP